MKKIVRQQNYLKELIDTQSNNFLTVQALKCLIRSVVEPLLDEPENGVVLHRLVNKDGLQGMLKRLEFSEVESVSFTDESNNLVEKVWANTEFICVLTHRFVSILIWDNHTGDKDLVRYYSLFNSKLQYEPLNIIKRNSKIDLTPYIEKYNPDRRDNLLLNASIRKLLNSIDESSSDAVLGYAEKNVEVLVDSDVVQKKSRVIAHEIRNQLSICDLYAEIIKKHTLADNKEGVLNSVNAINKAIKMANNCLLTLKTVGSSELTSIPLNRIINDAVELSQVYLEGKNIEFQIENGVESTVLANQEKVVAVIINLVKNAVEAFGVQEDCSENGKYIKIKTEIDENSATIYVSNNAEGVKNPEKIFNEGFTTKSTGSGLGLWICKKFIEEQMGELELSRTTEDYTEFLIRLGV